MDALPGRVFDCKVAMVYPEVDAKTRTNRVRFEVANPSGELHPGMYATVRIETPLRQIEPFRSMTPNSAGVLAVPEPAVIDTGDEQVVYIERKPGLFEGVKVKLGPARGRVLSCRRRIGSRPTRRRRWIVPDRRRNPLESRRRLDLLRRQRDEEDGRHRRALRNHEKLQREFFGNANHR